MPPNHRASLDAAIASSLHFGHPLRRASEWASFGIMYMRLATILVLTIMCTVLQAADTNLPMVRVDAKHQMVSAPATAKPEPYRIPACSGIVLDATGYTFESFPDLHGKPLNSIQVVQDKQHMFELTWQPG